MMAAVGSTALLHWVVRPFIHTFHLQKGAPNCCRAEMLDVLARIYTVDFKMEDIKPRPNVIHPFVNFEVNGKHFYIEPQGFKDKDTLRKILGQDPKESER
mmetsp:Transcript_19198/g.24782  ORF Transcript_19198/g.24782 Transcript_19198/m.24782 type:complete len:100 (+) Transcript_19198:2-301(+)